jgi:hypothetical protein
VCCNNGPKAPFHLKYNAIKTATNASHIFLAVSCAYLYWSNGGRLSSLAVLQMKLYSNQRCTGGKIAATTSMTLTNSSLRSPKLGMIMTSKDAKATRNRNQPAAPEYLRLQGLNSWKPPMSLSSKFSIVSPHLCERHG